MDPSDVWLLIVLLMLIYLSSFFSASETALTTVNRHRLRSLAENGNRKAALVLEMLEEQGKMLTTILIGNNIVNLSASALATVLANKIGGNLAVGIGTGLLTLVILIFGEISPKTIATIRAERLALKNVSVIHFLMTALTPLIFIVNLFSRAYLFLMRVNPNEKGELMTEDELRTIVEVSHEEGVIESDEKEMITNVFDLSDSQAKDVMIPRVDVVFADIETSYEDLLDIFREERFTRIPIYEESPDNVVGILNMKDLVLYKQGTPFAIRDYMREAYYTHEFKNTHELFHEMRQATIPMSIVLDEYGTTVGIITMEDILEEIVGDIRDEFDESELNDIQKVRDREYLVAGSYRLDDLNDEIGSDLQSEDYDSIGG
ncbi:MAG: hemolysin family protein, partial [Lachnospiraceae bacterium]